MKWERPAVQEERHLQTLMIPKSNFLIYFFVPRPKAAQPRQRNPMHVCSELNLTMFNGVRLHRPAGRIILQNVCMLGGGGIALQKSPLHALSSQESCLPTSI